MSLLNPWWALVAAVITVPLLILLYVLKLRRQTLRMASTMLWHASTEDLQANVPFQRLRRSLLLALQLLLLATLIAALSRPVLQAPTSASRVVLLIDRSASMNALEAGGVDPERGTRRRLDAALDAARQVVERLGRRSEPAELMVVAFASSAQVITGFESNRRLLLEAIDSIEPTDERADLDAALNLTGAFARRDETTDQPPPDVLLISDGGVGEPAATSSAGGFSLRAGNLRFVGVGPEAGSPVNNVGIAAFSARRDYQQPGRVLVFARLVNAGGQPVETTVTLRVDGEPVDIKPARIPAAGPDGLGEAAFTSSVEIPAAAVLTLTCGHRDDLSADNTAALVLRPPVAPRVGLIHAGPAPDRFLLGLLEAMEPQRLAVLPAGAEPGSVVDLDWPWADDELDLIVFDRVAPRDPGSVPTLTFGAAGQGVSARPPGRRAARVLSWDRLHPIMRHVSLDALVYTGFGGFELPDGWTALATGPDGPVIAVLAAGPARHVLVGFSLTDSNWPMDVSITVFLQNVVDYLMLAAGEAALSFRPGDPIIVRARPDATELSVKGPLAVTVPVEPGEEVALPTLRRVGLYAVRGAVPPMDRVAVNMISDAESDIRPRRSLVVNAQEAEAAAPGEAAPLELWPGLAVAALGLLVLEWIVYCLRMRG